jgi:hypothetical protein
MALAPALLLLVYLPGEMMLRCRLDGLLRPACCCPNAREAEPSGPVLKAQTCCAREVVETNRAAAEAARLPDHDPAPVAAVAIAVAAISSFTPPFASLGRAAQRHGPAREGPPIVLLKHAFLI